MMEVIIDIRGFSGDTTERELATLFQSVRCYFTPAKTNVAQMYEGVPTGQFYEFAILDQKAQSIPDGAELTIIHGQGSGLTSGTIFVVVAKTQHQILSGKGMLTGVCYKKEDSA